MKFSELSDDELGAMVRDRFQRLCSAHADGIADEHPKEQWNRDNVVLRAAKAAGAATDDSDEPAATFPTEGGAKDAAMRRSWSKASEPVRLSLDAAFSVAGRDASTTLALAEAHMRRLGHDSPSDNLYRELRAVHASVTQPRGAAASTRKAIAGYERLR